MRWEGDGEGERERVGERGVRKGLLELREEVWRWPLGCEANWGAGGARSIRVSGKFGSVGLIWLVLF